MKEIDELVEWVVDIMEDTELVRDKHEGAKRILSHPDLALIDKSQDLKGEYYLLVGDDIPAGTYILPVIPLAEALKGER